MATAPTNLQATVVSGTEVALSWGAVVGAVFYRIEVNGDPSAGLATNYFTSITGLTPDTQYTFRVTAQVFEGGEIVDGPWSQPVTVTTTPDPGTPDTLPAPTILSAQQSGLNALSLSWSAVTDAMGYEVRVDTGLPVDVGNVLGHEVTGLVPGTYTVEVRAYNTDADPDVFSIWSPVEITVEELQPPEITVRVISSSIVELTWDLVSAARRYDVRVNGTGISPAGSTGEHLVLSLEPETEYTFEVRSIAGTDPEVEGEWSDPATATTFPFVLPPEIVPADSRRAAFPSDRGISARALNTEFNNIYALMGLGEVEPALPEPDAPAPPPPDPVPPPPEPEPPPPDPTGAPTVVNAQVSNTTVATSGAGAVGDLILVIGADSLFDFVSWPTLEELLPADWGWRHFEGTGGGTGIYYIIGTIATTADPVSVDLPTADGANTSRVVYRIADHDVTVDGSDNLQGVGFTIQNFAYARNYIGLEPVSRGSILNNQEAPARLIAGGAMDYGFSTRNLLTWPNDLSRIRKPESNNVMGVGVVGAYGDKGLAATESPVDVDGRFEFTGDDTSGGRWVYLLVF